MFHLKLYIIFIVALTSINIHANTFGHYEQKSFGDTMKSLDLLGISQCQVTTLPLHEPYYGPYHQEFNASFVVVYKSLDYTPAQIRWWSNWWFFHHGFAIIPETTTNAIKSFQVKPLRNSRNKDSALSVCENLRSEYAAVCQVTPGCNQR